MLIALWPQTWSRQQRSNATLVAALVLMVLALSLLGQVLSFLPEPIGSNAQAFSDGARTTLWLTLVSGAVGLVLGTVAALARTARWVAVRWVASFYIWAIRGTPLLVQILFVYFALPVLVPGLNLPDFAAAVLALGLNVGAYNAEALRPLPREDWGNQENNGFDFVRILFPNVSIFVAPEITQVAQLFPGPNANENRTVLSYLSPTAPKDEEEKAVEVDGEISSVLAGTNSCGTSL